MLSCAPTATRTRDLLLRRQSLYPLSYRGPGLVYRRVRSGAAGGGAGTGGRAAGTGGRSGYGVRGPRVVRSKMFFKNWGGQGWCGEGWSRVWGL